MPTERETMLWYSQVAGTTLPEELRQLCTRMRGTASRLYILSSAGWGASITVLCGEYSQVIIQYLRGKLEEALPSWLKDRLGTFTIPDARARTFLERLAALGAWDKGECRTNSRDGMIWVNVMASANAEHCIQMNNPEFREDSAYREMVNLYAEEFLGQAFHLSPPKDSSSMGRS